ncbi:MAG: S1C family serine protease [Syntrophobacteraceae bacterium]
MTRVGVSRAFPLLLLVIAVTAAAADCSSKIFPFPMVETEHMITRWFMDSGYMISVEDSGSGEKHVSAQKAGEEWQIVLKPSSPLNTEVVARCSEAGTRGASRLDELWLLLDTNAQRARADMAAGDRAASKAVPDSVLQHEGAIICMENGPGAGHIQLSGFVCDDSGLILTTAHDIKESEALTVIGKDGRRFNGRVAKVDHVRDLALIQSDFRPGVAISLAQDRLTLDRGETIYAIGCPQGVLGTVYVGAVNSPPRLADTIPLWQVSMTVYPGSSGSPVFDAQGNLVGVVKGRYRGTDSVGFIIPMSIVIEFLGR